MTSFRYGLYVHTDWTTKVVSPLHLARTLGYVEDMWSRYLAYCIVYVHVYIFANVKESEQCHKNAKRTAVVAKCFAKGKFVLLDSVLTSIHNKNLLSIKQKQTTLYHYFKTKSKLVLSDSDNNRNRSTSCFCFWVF